MYRLMKSEKFTINHQISGRSRSYRQTEVNNFTQFSAALIACEAANNKGKIRHYILNELTDRDYSLTVLTHDRSRQP